jgi:hypothetical protein
MGWAETDEQTLDMHNDDPQAFSKSHKAQRVTEIFEVGFKTKGCG